MKIGISALGYECVEHLGDVLKPWRSPELNAQIFISAAHGVFPETHQLGYSTVSTDGSVDVLQKLKEQGVIDEFKAASMPMFERDLRNLTLPFLMDNQVDYLWMLDLQDEIYTVEQINKIIEYIKDPQKDLLCWFKLRFKNYVFSDKTYVDDFIAPRIWRNDRCGGISRFYYDNEIEYNNMAKQEHLFHEEIPKDVAFIKHLSWVGSPEYLQRKIKFQRIHYGDCSYDWDVANNKLIFNELYYKKFNKAKPIIHQD